MAEREAKLRVEQEQVGEQVLNGASLRQTAEARLIHSLATSKS
jgi:hypothetical protein